MSNIIDGLHMVGGEGETSYAKNSIVQKSVLTLAKPYVQKAISDLYYQTFPECLIIADFGCSTGLNSILPTLEILDAIHETCQKMGRPSPEVQVFLNDLPSNDFNSIFNSIPSFYDKLRKGMGQKFAANCYIAGVPGSFYGRLFPSQTLSFGHSSTSVHWLSQVPQGIESNKGNIYLAKTSPPEVFRAYFDQFQRDFSLFLNLRSEELLHSGRMVITVAGRRSLECYSKECCYLWELLAESLRGMVLEGLVEEAKLEAFNLPYYTPNLIELKKVIEVEGSFSIDILDTFDINWDAKYDPKSEFAFDKAVSGQNVAKFTRAVVESMLVAHFGEEIIEELFHRHAKLVGEHLVREKTRHVLVIMCLIKK